jgi:hypothetical protein
MGKRGGYRPGSGRPKGQKNKATMEREKVLRERGITSLDFLQETYADTSQPMHIRLAAAVASLPYEHSKLPIEARIETSQAVHVQVIDYTAANVLAELEGEDPDMIDVTPTNGSQVIASNGAAKPSTEAKPKVEARPAREQSTVEALLR